MTSAIPVFRGWLMRPSNWYGQRPHSETLIIFYSHSNSFVHLSIATIAWTDSSFIFLKNYSCIPDVFEVKLLSFIIPPLRHFTILGQKNAQNMPRYYTVEQGKNTDWRGATKWPHKTNRTLPCLRPLTLTSLKMEEWWNNISLIRRFNI